MAEAFTVEEHPLTAVVLHWVHLVSFLSLAVTGLLIWAAPVGWNIAAARNFHFVMMFVFVLTTIVRIYWAFLGRGSADTGKTTLVRDYKHFAPEAANKGLFIEWIKYYLFVRKSKPPVPKYGTLQKMTYGILFPVSILLMALTGFAMWSNTAAAMMWFTNLLGGLDTVRMWHLFLCWIMLIFVAIHVYLVVFEEPVQLYSMLFHVMPEKYRPRSMRGVKGAAEAAKD